MWPFIITQCVIARCKVPRQSMRLPRRADALLAVTKIRETKEETGGAPVVPLCSRRVLAGITY